MSVMAQEFSQHLRKTCNNLAEEAEQIGNLTKAKVALDVDKIPSGLTEYLEREPLRGELIFYLKESAETLAKAKYWDFADEIAVVTHPDANGGVIVLAKYKGQWGVCNHTNRQIVGALLGVREDRQ